MGSRCMQSHCSVAQARKMYQSVVSVPLLVLVVALSAPLCQPRPQLDFLTNMLGNTVEAVSSGLKDYDSAPYTVVSPIPNRGGGLSETGEDKKNRDADCGRLHGRPEVGQGGRYAPRNHR